MQGCHEGGWATGAACPGPPQAPDPTQFIVGGGGGGQVLLCCPGPTKTFWGPCVYNINNIIYNIHIII